MNRILAGATCVVLPLAAWTALPRAQADVDSEPDLAALMPESTWIYAEGPGLAGLFAGGLDHPLVARLLGSELGELFLAQAETSPEDALERVEERLGRSPLKALEAMTARGIALGVGYKRGEPVYAIAARGGEPEEMSAVLRDALGWAAEQHGLERSQLIEPHGRIRGAGVWYLGDELTLALEGDLFLASNDEGRLRDMLDLGALEEAAGLASRPGFAEATRGVAGDELAWAWFDLAGLAQVAAEPVKNLRAATGNPGLQFLLGPVFCALGSGEAAYVELELDAERLALDVESFGVAAGVAQSVQLPLDARPPSLPSAKESDGARALVYRDLAGLFRQRTEMFPADVLPKFAEATSTLALFFGGADVTDGILPAISPWLGVIVRPVAFDEGATPDIPLPAAAIVARLEDAGRLGEQMFGAFHTLVGVINVEAAQNMQPQLIPKLELVQADQVLSAHYVEPAPGGGVDLRYNLVPAVALVDDAFVLATHRELAKELVGQLRRGEVEAPAGGGEHLSLEGAAAARVVRDNAEALAMNGVLNEGKTMEQASGEVRALASIADMVERLELFTQRPTAASLRVGLRVDFTERGE